jgi:predicted ATP-dependent serine protease
MPTRWIVEPLIAEGHQVILAGEPKAGKSLLASQLCLEIAKGPGQLLQISLPGVASAIRPGEKLPPGAFRVATKNGATLKPGKVPAEAASGQKWKVLYVSFEMSPQVMWARTSQQATSAGSTSVGTA